MVITRPSASDSRSSSKLVMSWIHTTRLPDATLEGAGTPNCCITIQAAALQVAIAPRQLGGDGMHGPLTFHQP